MEDQTKAGMPVDVQSLVSTFESKNEAGATTVVLPFKGTEEMARQAIETFDKYFCLQCGQCCRGFKRGAEISQSELIAFAKRTNKHPDAFEKEYTERKEGNLHLKNPCPLQFFNMCTVYDIRPSACLIFPIGVQLRPSANGSIPALAVYTCRGGIAFVQYMNKVAEELTRQEELVGHAK